MRPYRFNPRSITEKALSRLRKTLKDFGDLGGIIENVAPPEVAPLTTGQLVGGHMRLRAMFGERAGEFALSEADIEIIRTYDPPTEQGTVAEGYIIWHGQRYAFRRVIWDDDTFRWANFISNHPAGEWDWDMFANTIGPQELLSWGYDPSEWLRSLNRDVDALASLVDTTSNDDNPYTWKIQTPIYKPSKEKPDISSLVDLSKYNALIAQIDASNISEEEKQFLRYAAARHIVFDYQLIADYYAHSSPEIQELFEKSALVIVDFNKAIEEGYVELVREIIEQYEDEYGDDA